MRAVSSLGVKEGEGGKVSEDVRVDEARNMAWGVSVNVKSGCKLVGCRR